jgi:DNA-binding protein YbaB
MFKQNNPKALMSAQHQIETLMNEFDKNLFVGKSGTILVEISGAMKLKSIQPAVGEVLSESVMLAYDEAMSILEHDRAVILARVRNKVQKEFRFDIKGLIPEIANAVAYLDAKKQ